MTCERCGEITIGSQLCVYCRGERVRQPRRAFTELEWTERVLAAADKVGPFLELAENTTKGPGEAVLVLLLTAEALVESSPQIPHFDWYVHQAIEITAAARETRRNRQRETQS